MTTTFRSKRAIGLLVIGLFLLVGAEAFQTYEVQQNASTLREVVRSQRRIETVVKPVCVTAGQERQCHGLLVAADKNRVASLCHLTARVLRNAGLDAKCIIPPAVKQRSGGGHNGSAKQGISTTTTAPDGTTRQTTTVINPPGSPPGNSPGSSNPPAGGDGGNDPGPGPGPTTPPGLIDKASKIICNMAGVCVHRRIP